MPVVARQRSYASASGQFTQRDPIGLAGGLNQYGYAGGDPIGNSDPLGLYVKVHGSLAFRRWVEAYKDSNPEFKADYERADADTTATYVIIQDPKATSGRVWGGMLEDGEDLTGDPARKIKEWNVQGPFKAPVASAIMIGTAPRHAPVGCQLRHEFVHARGLFNRGTHQLGRSNHAEFVSINRLPGCQDGNEHRPR